MGSIGIVLLALATAGLGDMPSGQPVLLDFYADYCPPCREMEPTVARLAKMGYPVRKVDTQRHPELASRFGIEGIPCFVLVVDGRELARHEGPAELDELRQMFAKAQRPAKGSQPGRSSDNGLAKPVRLPGEDAASPLAIDSLGADEPATSDPPQQGEPGNPSAAIQKLLAASVRLKVEDPDGHSYGSGTIIDSRSGQALILTCAHIFRDSQGKGTITVDLFGEGALQDLPGELIGYDLESDVGLVSIRPDAPVTSIPVAPPGYAVHRGDKVVSVGCNNGSRPTARRSRVTGLDKFLGPSNLQVAGQPVTGRSGGGLFTSDGCVVGVCNAADPTDDEGLYAALASIHAELDRQRLSHVYEARQIAATDPLRDERRVPAMPKSMPSVGERSPRQAPVETAGNSDPFAGRERQAGGQQRPDQEGRNGSRSAPAALDREQLTSGEEAALNDIRENARAAEVICIIRSHDDPRAKSEIIVLDRASPAFLELLSGEQRSQTARHPTSLAVGRQGGAAGRESAAPRRAPRHWQPNWRQRTIADR